jgi:tetratricopeptide (TPR) repeat protein
MSNDLVSIRSELGGNIRRALQREPLAPQQPTRDDEAFRAYLRGRYFWNKRTAEGLRAAIRQFQDALDRDPDYALAWVGLGDSYALLEQYAGIPARENCPKAKAAVLRAQQLDASLAQPYASLGLLYGHCEWDWTRSQQSFEEALRLDPNYATAYHWYALHLTYRAMFSEAAEKARRAQQLDPLSLIANNAISVVNGYAGNWDEVLIQSDRLIDMDPNFPVAHLWKGRALRAKKRYDEAIVEFKRALELSHGLSRESMGELGSAYAMAGQRQAAEQWIRTLQKQKESTDAASYAIACIYASLGDRAHALDWLDRAFAAHGWFLVQLEVEPLFAPLRGDKRFEELVRRVHLK